MRLLVVGDVHWSEYSSIIRKRGDKYSKRLENLINSLNWTEEVAELNSVDRVVFLGDFFDRQNLNASEITALQEVMWSNIPHDFLVGNHEGLLEDLSTSSSHLFKLIPNARVIDKPTFDCGFGYKFLYLPYCLEENRKTISYWLNHFQQDMFFTQEVKKTVIFSHNDLKIQYGLVPPTNGYELDDIDSNCDLFLNGHLHSGGKFSNKGYNVGNLTGQNFGEDATKCSHNILLYDTQTNEQVWIENPYAFNFYKFDFVSGVSEMEHLVDGVKNNAIITAKVPETKALEVRELLTNIVINNGKVKEFRVISIPTELDITEVGGEDVIESVNHLDEFVNFVKLSVDMTPIVIEELSEICK